MLTSTQHAETLNTVIIISVRTTTKRKYKSGLAGVAQWIECRPANRSCQVDPQSGHMPGLWAKSLVEGMQETTTHFPSL